MVGFGHQKEIIAERLSQLQSPKLEEREGMRILMKNMLVVKMDTEGKIITEDGITGVFDVSPYLGLEAFIELRNQDAFRKVMNGKYFIEWDCGADLSADTIEAHLKTT